MPTGNTIINMTGKLRAKRITVATLRTYAQTLGRGSIADRAFRHHKELTRDGIKVEVKMVATGFILQTCCHAFRYA